MASREDEAVVRRDCDSLLDLSCRCAKLALHDGLDGLDVDAPTFEVAFVCHHNGEQFVAGLKVRKYLLTTDCRLLSWSGCLRTRRTGRTDRRQRCTCGHRYGLPGRSRTN